MHRKRSIIFWISAGKAGVMLVLTLMLMCFAVPRFVEVFAEFGAELPKLTQLVVNLSLLLQQNFLLLILPIAGLSALCLWGLVELDKRRQSVWILTLSFIPTILALLIIVPLLLPLLQVSNVIDR